MKHDPVTTEHVVSFNSSRPLSMIRLRAETFERDGNAVLVVFLARRFTALVRSCGIGHAARVMAALPDLDTRRCPTFAVGLEQSGAAARAALILPWSNGQAAGQGNRLKLLKRQSYGHTGFDLLRWRVLLAA